MAIRFHCPGCNQPIEVDDAWASRLVACPYCRKTVTAPAATTLGDLGSIPTAAPLGPPVAGAPPVPPESAARSNPLAVAAIVFTILTLALSVMLSVTGSRHRLEIEELERELRVMGPDASPMKAGMEYIQKHGGQVPGWLLLLSLYSVGVLLSCLSGLICGLLALRRPARRAMAVISVFACGGLTAWTALGLLLGPG